MKNFRKILAGTLILAFALSICSCSDNSSKRNKRHKRDRDDDSETEVEEEEEEEEETTEEPEKTSAEPEETSETTEETSEETTVEETEPTVPEGIAYGEYDPDGGPVLKIENPEYVLRTDFELVQYSLDTGEYTKLLDFNNDYTLDSGEDVKLEFVNSGKQTFFERHVFDSDFDRMAVCWRTKEEGTHVGWLDKDGVLTDVTEMFRGDASMSFSALPFDKFPLFTERDTIYILDYNAVELVEYDPETNEGTTIIKPEEFPYLVYGETDNEKGLYCGWLNDFLHLGGIDPSSSYIGDPNFTCDYVKYPDGSYSYIAVDPLLYHYVMEYSTEEEMKDWDDQCIKLTPDTDWTITSVAYKDGKILFTGTRKDVCAVFEMDYADHVCSEPVLVTELEMNTEIVYWD